MNLINCDSLPVVLDRFYGGMTGPKIGVKYDDRVWMLKCGQDLSRKQLKNVTLSHANDPISEYIGSSIYKLFDIPVHDVLLGTYHGELCCLCSDDAYPNPVIEFRQFRNAMFDSDIDMGYSGMSVDLDSILQVIKRSDRIPTDAALERFWSMFVVDTLIGNTDRNNGNWGFIYNDGHFDLYEVYDCGGCLNNKRSDEQMKVDLCSNNIEQIALNYLMNLTVNGSRINPFHYIEKNCNKYIHSALLRVDPRLEEPINEILCSLTGIISNDRYEWYKAILFARMRKLYELRYKFLLI